MGGSRPRLPPEPRKYQLIFAKNMVSRKRLNIAQEGLVFVTTTVSHWNPVFSDERLAHIALTQFAETTQYFSTDVIAYCLMPSHLHAIISLPLLKDLSKLMGSFKSLSSRLIKKNCSENILNSLIYDGAFHLWIPRFDDYIFRNYEQLRIKINYIHDNPVRANLVEKPCDWKYSSARDWLLDKIGPLEIRKIRLD